MENENNNGITVLPIVLSVLLIILGTLTIGSTLRKEKEEKTIILSEEGITVESMTFSPEIVLNDGLEEAEEIHFGNNASFPMIEAYIQAATEPETAKVMLLCAGTAAVLLGAGMALKTKKKQKENG